MNREIFREYDIRGIVDEDLTDEFVVLLGKAIGTHTARHGCKKLVVGMDCRESSPRFRDRIVEGVMSTGRDVVDIGVVPTPLLYYALQTLDVDGGVMITASHNPAEYNGFKVAVGKSTIYGAEIQKLADLIEEEDFENAPTPGTSQKAEVVADYIDYVANNISLTGKKIEIAVDGGNGTGGPVALPLLERLGVTVHPLYCDMDGTFPNHHPDPTDVKNVQELIALVKEKNLAAGIGFDGDTDRIGVIDDQGNIIWGDKLMILFSRAVLEKQPGATIIGEVKCSNTLYDDIKAHGGNGIMWRTGHSLIKAKMKEVDAALAGEMSGHMFFADRFFGFDDAIYAACRLVEILDQSGKKLSELLADVPQTFATPEIRVDCPEERKQEVVEKVSQYFKQKYDVVDVDGVRVVYPDGWGLLRASNTQPVLVLRFEATTEERMNEIKAEVEKALHEIGGL
jgi:phosphomannomutase/phosphoglucomutase